MPSRDLKNQAIQKKQGRPSGKKNSSIRADRLEVIQLVSLKLIAGMATASSSELARSIWPEETQDKVVLNARSKTVRLALQNISNNPEVANVSQDDLRKALTERVSVKKSKEDIEKEKEEKEAARQVRLEMQRKEWFSQPIRVMESRIKAMVKESLGINIGEGVTQSVPMPSFNVNVASNTFTRESALRVLEIELKIQLQMALRYTWDGETALRFYQKAKELVKIKKRLLNHLSLDSEETDELIDRLKQLRVEVEQAYEKMNSSKGWGDPDLSSGQQLSSYDLKHKVIQLHTNQVETWADEKLPADVQIPKDKYYPEADKPWNKEPLQQLDPNSKAETYVNPVPIEENEMQRDIANTIAAALLRMAGITKEPQIAEGDFFSTNELEYLCMFYTPPDSRKVAKALGRTLGSVIKKYHWLDRLNLINYYKERYLQKEKAPVKTEG